MKELYKIICSHPIVQLQRNYPKYIFYFIKNITLYISCDKDKYKDDYISLTFSIEDAKKWVFSCNPPHILQPNKNNDGRKLPFKTDDYDTVYNIIRGYQLVELMRGVIF